MHFEICVHFHVFSEVFFSLWTLKKVFVMPGKSTQSCICYKNLFCMLSAFHAFWNSHKWFSYICWFLLFFWFVNVKGVYHAWQGCTVFYLLNKTCFAHCHDDQNSHECPKPIFYLHAQSVIKRQLSSLVAI